MSTRVLARIAVALIVLAAGIGVYSFLTREDDTYDVVAYFPRAVSLYEQGSVQVLGLPAGRIADIEVVGDQVKVTMAIDDDIPIPTGVQAAIAPQSLIGERRIQLSPPYREGDETIDHGHVITEDNTIVPVEPDEALDALKEFLDSLDANGIGRLIENGAETLDGQGENLGQAIDELTTLVDNIEDNDADIISIAERFDDFTSTLLTREAQLASAIDDFATVAGILADERGNIEALIDALADLSGSGLDLVSEHAVRLRTDVDILERLAASIAVNIDTVDDIVPGALELSRGLANAYNPEVDAINLRTNLDSVVVAVLDPLLKSLGLPPINCLDLISTVCPEGTSIVDGLGNLVGAGTDGAVSAELPSPTSPIDDILATLGTPGEVTETAPAQNASDPSLLDRFVGTFLGVGS